MIRGYAVTTGCHRQFLLGYFGKRLEQPCGNCDTYFTGTAEALSSGSRDFPVISAVEHAERGRAVVMFADGDTVTVVFDEHAHTTCSPPSTGIDRRPDTARPVP